RKVPASSLFALLRNTTAAVPGSVAVDGEINATFEISRDGTGEPAEWKGDGELLDATLRGETSDPPVHLDRIPFTIGSQETDSTHTGGSTTIEIGPVAIALGRPSSIQTRASFSLLGYEASVRGEAGLKRLLQVARAFGIPAPAVSGDGISNVDLVISRAWW